jgi:hypothetical protein
VVSSQSLARLVAMAVCLITGLASVATATVEITWTTGGVVVPQVTGDAVNG